ncbi:MAG: hypothetical protein EB127_06825, partial [Alphaproteobacteria bacterium]|nr:hypothetical protein [Alphaproteobacteria bacterium]
MRSINFFVIYTLFFGLTSLFAVDAIAVSELIIEATEQSADDIVILRHNKSLRLSIIYKDGELIARSDSPIKFLISPASKKYLLFDVKLQKNSKELLMKTRRKYKSYSVVNGEKFTAIKLINQTKPVAEQAPKEVTPKNNTSVPQISTDSKSVALPQTSLETSAQDPTTKAIIWGNSSNIEITFPFKEQIGGAAFVRNNKVFICFDKSQEVIFPQTTLLAHQPKIYKLEDATLITIALPDKKVPEFVYNQKHWTLSFRSKDSKAKKSYNIQKLDQVSGIAINQNSLQKIIVFKDEEVGDNIAMVTDIASSNSINAPIHFNDFELTKTLSGVAAFWVAEDITTEIKNGVLRIFSPNLAVADKQSQPKEQAPPEKKEVKESLNETQALNPKSLLPLNYCSTVKGNFSEMKLSLLRALSISDKSNERENALKLSQFFFCYDMIEEALGSANIIQLDTNFLLNNPSFPFYKSVLYSLLDRFEEANEILEVSNSISGDVKKDSGQISEVDLWTKLNKFYVSSKPISTDALQYIDNILKLYPEEIYWRVIFTEL